MGRKTSSSEGTRQLLGHVYSCLFYRSRSNDQVLSNRHAGKSAFDKGLQAMTVSTDQCILAGVDGSPLVKTQYLSGRNPSINMAYVDSVIFQFFFFIQTTG